MQKKIVSTVRLFWPEILPPTPFDGLELTPESYYESSVFLLTKPIHLNMNLDELEIIDTVDP